MMGDNRDHSEDSRFWGSVERKLIVGTPWFVTLSVETRSFDDLRNAYDHATLKDACGDIELLSEKCKDTWNKKRFSFRWERAFSGIESIENMAKTYSK